MTVQGFLRQLRAEADVSSDWFRRLTGRDKVSWWTTETLCLLALGLNFSWAAAAFIAFFGLVLMVLIAAS